MPFSIAHLAQQLEAQQNVEQTWEARLRLGADTLKRFLEEEGWVGQPEYYLQYLSNDLGKLVEKYLRLGAQKLRDILPECTKFRKRVTQINNASLDIAFEMLEPAQTIGVEATTVRLKITQSWSSLAYASVSARLRNNKSARPGRTG